MNFNDIPVGETLTRMTMDEVKDNERDCEMRLLVGCDLGGGCCGSCVGTVRFKQFGKKVHIKMGPNGYISMLISIDYFIHDMTSIHATLCLFQRWLLKPSIVAPCVCED